MTAPLAHGRHARHSVLTIARVRLAATARGWLGADVPNAVVTVYRGAGQLRKPDQHPDRPLAFARR